MSRFINIVRVRVKKDSKKDYLKKIKNVANIEGLISSKHIETGPNTYCMVEEWITKEALMKARKMIEIFDKVKPLISDNSSEINITNSVGGTIITEKYIKKNKTELPESRFLNSEKIGKKHFYFIYANS